jgi:polar amino acid transport system substrate-binding protein
MKPKLYLGFIFAFLFIFISCNNQPTTNSVQDKSVYERVLEKGTIRVGYVLYPPGLIKDPNTGQFSGIFYEVMQKVGANLNLKVEYVEEVTWQTLVESVKNDKVDIIGSPVWPTAERGKFSDFTIPIYLGSLKAYVRADDNRFDGDLSKANINSVSIVTIDGEISTNVKASDFPNAKDHGMPNTTLISQMLLEVSGNKADIAFVEPFVAGDFINKNPNKIKEVKDIQPLRIYPNNMMVKKGEVEFTSMINTALQELMNNGEVDKIIAKYEPFKGAFYRNALIYQPLE